MPIIDFEIHQKRIEPLLTTLLVRVSRYLPVNVQLKV